MKLRTKKQKIEFLQKLQKGQADLTEILPEQIEIWFQTFDETGFRNDKVGFLSNADFEAMPPKAGNNTKIIVFYGPDKRDKPIE